jgi:hypothetical protein
VQNAATGNLDFVKNLQSQGFQSYGGQQVANFAPQQQSSFDMTNATANNGTATARRRADWQLRRRSGRSRVQAQSIASNMSPYMNQYVMQALAPQLQQMDVHNAKTRARRRMRRRPARARSAMRAPASSRPTTAFNVQRRPRGPDRQRLQFGVQHRDRRRRAGLGEQL